MKRQIYLDHAYKIADLIWQDYDTLRHDAIEEAKPPCAQARSGTPSSLSGPSLPPGPCVTGKQVTSVV